jgi:type IV pilus assembly protein PilM
MAQKKAGGPIVGLDIGTSFIKACEVDCRGGRVNLRGITVIPTPPGVMTNNEIIDPVTLGRAIRQALQQAGIKAKKVVSSVTGQTALVVRIIEVPKMTRNELQETMKWEIERHVPFAAEQVVMDYKPLTPPELVPEGQNMEVLLAVAQEALVNRHLETVQAAGLQAVAIDLEALASSRSLLDLANGDGPEGTVAIIDMGATSTDISIYREGRIAFTRTIQLAGNNLTKAISDTVHQPLAEAERLKKEMAVVSAQPSVGNDMFGDQFGGLPTLDFGMGDDTAPMGGTFGVSADPGASTATDDAAATFDVAGGGFTAESFTEAAPSVELQGDSLAGPAPAANPFDPDAALVPGGGPAPAASPFDSSLFGPSPANDPFAPVDPAMPFGVAPAMPAPGALSSVPAAMSEEDMLRTQIGDAIMPVLQELVTELRRSLDFYRNRANGLGAQQIVLTGGTARLQGLAEYLTVNLEAPVVVGNPLQYLSTGQKADPKYLQDVGPVFPVSVGLAVRELLADEPAGRKKR